VFVWIGGNDFRDVDQWMQAAPNVIKGIEELKEMCVKSDNIYLVNMTVLYEMPSYNKSDEKGLLEISTNLYNGLLKGIYQSEGIKFINLFDFHKKILKNPAEYSFDNVLDSCQGKAPDKNACTGFMFYDGVHPTVAAHKVIAEDIERSL
jgi:phospholipase/lecithinase/hemolysin